MENGPEDAYTCPSFNSYYSERLTEIAGKVAVETSCNEEEFEFALGREGNNDEFFYKGKIGPVFPVFCRDLLSSYEESGEHILLGSSAEEVEGIKVPLSKLLEETRRDENDRDPASCSSSEADELESIPAGTYCVWRPKVALSETPSPSRCKKSKSTGSASKRWKIPEFLRRSNSEGKDSLVFMTPKHGNEKRDKTEASRRSTERTAAGTAGPSSAHEALYVQNRAKKENDRKKSYLPYRPDLVGFFASSSPRF